MRIGDFGQPRLEALLDEMLERGRVTGSFLFEGPQGTGKEALAVELGRLLNCENGGRCPAKPPFARRDGSGAAAPPRCSSCRKFDVLKHPDLLLVFPVPADTWDEPIPQGRGDGPHLNTIGKILFEKAKNPYYRKQDWERPLNIAADVLRERVLPKVYSRPVEGRMKVLVISDAEIMAPAIGNTLLKTLEEPPENTLLVLTSSVPQRLLPTILSRCQRFRFVPLDPEWMQARLAALYPDEAPQKVRLAASVAQGSMLAAARFLLGGLEQQRELALDVLEFAASGRHLELLEIASQLGQEHAKKRQQVPVLMQMLVAVAHDALLLQADAVAAGPGRGAAASTGPRLVNADSAARIAKIAAALGDEALHAVIQKAEAIDKQLAVNVAVEHALAALFLGIAPEAAALATPPRGSSGRDARR